LNRVYRNSRDIFNHRHAKLRNIVERTFGVLKSRFPILKGKTGIPYPYAKQVKIVIACCILHNFIRRSSRLDALFNSYDNEDIELDTQSNAMGGEAHALDSNEDEQTAGDRIRNEIAQELWMNWNQ
jgi:hypothetical protein